MDAALPQSVEKLPPIYLELVFYATQGRLDSKLRRIIVPIEPYVVRRLKRRGVAKKKRPSTTAPEARGDDYEEGFFEALTRGQASDSEDEGGPAPYLRPEILRNTREAADRFFAYHRVSSLSRAEATAMVAQLPVNTPEEHRLQREVRRRVDALDDEVFDEVFDPDASASADDSAPARSDDDDEISSDDDDLHALMQRPRSPLLTRHTQLLPTAESSSSSPDDDEEEEEEIDSDAEPVELELDDSMFDDDGAVASATTEAARPATPSITRPAAPSIARPAAPSAVEEVSPVIASSSSEERPDPSDPTWLARSRAGDYRELLWMADVTNENSERLLSIRLKSLRDALMPIAEVARAATKLKQNFLTDTYQLLKSLRKLRSSNVSFDRSQVRSIGQRGSQRMIMLGMLPMVLALMPVKLRRMLHVPSLSRCMREFHQRYVTGDKVMGSLYGASLKRFIHNTNYIWAMKMHEPLPRSEPAPLPPLIEIPASATPAPKARPQGALRWMPTKTTTAARSPPHPRSLPPAVASQRHSAYAFYGMEIKRIDQALENQDATFQSLQQILERTRLNMSQLYAYRTQLIQDANAALAGLSPPPPAQQPEVIVVEDVTAPPRTNKRPFPEFPTRGNAQPSPAKRPRLVDSSSVNLPHHPHLPPPLSSHTAAPPPSTIPSSSAPALQPRRYTIHT